MRPSTLLSQRISAALIFAAAAASPALADKKDNTVRFASPTTFPSLDKYFNSGLVAAGVSAAVWDALIYRDPESGELKGDLATDWRWINDKTLELDLREGVKFHNGAAFDADDVVYTLSFIADPKNKALDSRISGWLDHVEKVDRYKVRLVTRMTAPAVVAYLATADIPIYLHVYYAAVGPRGMSAKPVGSGPYRVSEYAVGKFLRLERNSSYFKNSPKPPAKVEKIEIRFIPDLQTEVAEVVAGGLDLIMRVPRDQAEQLRTMTTLRVGSGETANVAALRMNTLPQGPSPQLRDIRVRKPINYAIDRETIAKFLVGENARVLHSPCHPVEFGCDDRAVPHYEYNPQKAKQLLADAGLSGGFDIDLYTFYDRNEAEVITGYLNAVGIRTHLHFLQAGALESARRSGKVALNLGAWLSQPLDMSDEVSVFNEFVARDFNRDPEVRDLLKRGDSSLDPDIRKEAYARALALIAERAYAVPLYSRTEYYVANKDLVFTPHLDAIPRFYEMSWK